MTDDTPPPPAPHLHCRRSTHCPVLLNPAPTNHHQYTVTSFHRLLEGLHLLDPYKVPPRDAAGAATPVGQIPLTNSFQAVQLASSVVLRVTNRNWAAFQLLLLHKKKTAAPIYTLSQPVASPKLQELISRWQMAHHTVPLPCRHG